VRMTPRRDVGKSLKRRAPGAGCKGGQDRSKMGDLSGLDESQRQLERVESVESSQEGSDRDNKPNLAVVSCMLLRRLALTRQFTTARPTPKLTPSLPKAPRRMAGKSRSKSSTPLEAALVLPRHADIKDVHVELVDTHTHVLSTYQSCERVPCLFRLVKADSICVNRRFKVPGGQPCFSEGLCARTAPR
jgi:hypothetical protein